MPRPKNPQPKYRFHCSGQAFVEFNGQKFYLGKHGSPQSRAKYLELVSEYQQSGFQTPGQPTQQADEPLSLAALLTDFRANGLKRLGRKAARIRQYEMLCEIMEDDCAHISAEHFGPVKLEEIRQGFLEAGNCRKFANEKTGMVLRIFKWAVSRELIPASRLVALQSLEPLKIGEARDNPKRQPVAREDVLSTLPHLAPSNNC